MSTPTELLLVTCPPWESAVFCAALDAGNRALCPKCGYGVPVEKATRFDAVEWSTCSNPLLIQTCLLSLGLRHNDRKQRLHACGIARTALDLRQDYGLRLAIECGEALADRVPPPILPDLALRALEPERVIGGEPPQSAIARSCIQLEFRAGPRTTLPGVSDELWLAIYRDIVPNPFLVVTWKLDWLTSMKCYSKRKDSAAIKTIITTR